MPEYKVEVTTGNMRWAGTWNGVYVTIYGSEGQSERTKLDNWGLDFKTNQVSTYTVSSLGSLGKVLLLKVEKESVFPPFDDEWYCSKIVVTLPEGLAILFPCYRWISTGEQVELRGGKAVKVFEEVHPLLVKHRGEQLSLRKNLYQWKTWTQGLPHAIAFEDLSELPTEIRFSSDRSDEVKLTRIMIGIELKLKGMLGSSERFESLEDMKKIFTFKTSTISEYVAEHWKDDEFFGYQFLNGVNPNRIKKCSELPRNFPVTDKMVKPFLKDGSSLKKEMKEGHIFIYDQKKMDGIPGRTYNGEPLPVTPGLCLLYLNPENKLIPIAIQLQQQPSEKNPIFLPSDSETDWLLAKMFIKNADIMDHESVHHLMNTHFLAEVFTVATLRCLPDIHPLYKLLIPHFHCTLHINMTARIALLGPEKPLSMSSLGTEGIKELMRRSLSEMTYSSLCLPESITAGGMESVPDYYYRDDGLKLWKIISRFVSGIVRYYYPTDSEVQKDSELQEWIREIFTHGFLGNTASGFPTSFNTVAEVVTFITMVIFTVSAQHAAVNSGQFDYGVFIPNAPILLHKPPPTTKGQTSPETILETIPSVGETAAFAALLLVLSTNYSDQVLLGTYPEQRFDDPAAEMMITTFQEELSHLSEEINERNSKLDIPYTYMNPCFIENSVSK